MKGVNHIIKILSHNLHNKLHETKKKWKIISSKCKTQPGIF
jgi:hypothetical protein